MRTNLHVAQLEHFIASAARARRVGHTIAAERFDRYATDILNTHRVPNASHYRNQIEGTP